MKITRHQNELIPDNASAGRQPTQSRGFARSQRLVPVPGADGQNIIDALGTHNVIGRTFSFFASSDVQPILPYNSRRVGLTIQNVSGADIYVGIGSQPSQVGNTYINGILIENGGFYEPHNNYIAVNDIFVLGTSASQQIVVIELTKI